MSSAFPLIGLYPPTEQQAHAFMCKGVRYVAYTCTADRYVVRIIDLHKPICYIVDYGRPTHPYESVCDCDAEQDAILLLTILNDDPRSMRRS